MPEFRLLYKYQEWIGVILVFPTEKSPVAQARELDAVLIKILKHFS